jgi:transposase
MAGPYSNDLRARIGAAVRDGFTVREAADLFNVSAATAARCGKRLRDYGSAAAKAMGGAKRDVLAGHKAWLRDRIKAAPDLTLSALVAELAGRGVHVSRWAVWNFCRVEQLTFKKKHSAKRAKPAHPRSAT